MPRWVSKEGVWHPAKEKVALTDKEGQPFIYEGPDRAAVEQNKKEGITQRGVHFTQDTEWIARVRQLHNMSMEEYMKMCGYDEKTSLATFEANFAKVQTHEQPTRVPQQKNPSGGKNTAGTSGHMSGDFGEPEVLSRPAKKV